MTEIKARFSLRELERALARLAEALALPEDSELWVDGTVQRFEFTIELYWKTLRQILDAEGIETATPRQTLRQAYRSHLIDNETAWVSLLKARNATSHAYNEALARRVLETVKRRFPVMRDTLPALAARVAALESEDVTE